MARKKLVDSAESALTKWLASGDSETIRRARAHITAVSVLLTRGILLGPSAGEEEDVEEEEEEEVNLLFALWNKVVRAVII